MADLNDALERLISDSAFRQAVGDDPERALEGYDLSEDDRKMLSAQLSDDPGVRGGLEQRTSKSALAGLFGGGGSGESDLEFLSRHAEHGNSEPPTEEISFVYEDIRFGDGEDPTLAFNPKEFPISKPIPSPPLEPGEDYAEPATSEPKEIVVVGSPPPPPPAGGENSSNWIRIKGDWGEPDEPSALTGGGDTGEGPSGMDGTGKTDSGKYVVTSVQHGAGEPSAALPSDPDVGEDSHEIEMDVHVGRSQAEGPFDITAGEAEIDDGTSKTAMVSESRSGSDGDPLVGKITPKGESEMSSSYIKMASFQNTSPEGPVEVDGAVGDDQGAVAPGHEEEMEIHFPSWGQTGDVEDPDQPIIAGTLYNPPGAKAGSSAPADLSDGGAHEPGAVAFEAAGEEILINDPFYPESTGAGLRSDGELVQDEEGPREMVPTGRGAEEGIEGTDGSTGYTSEPGDIGDDLADDPPED